MTEDGSDRTPVVRDVAAIWPLYGLHIRTSRLELRLPTDADLPAVAAAARVIQPERAPRYQRSWMYEPSPAMERQLLRQHWRDLAHWRPESWHLGLAAFLDGVPIGMQDMWATDFTVSRSVATGSWVRHDMRMTDADFAATADQRDRISIAGVQSCLTLFGADELVPPAGVDPEVRAKQ